MNELVQYDLTIRVILDEIYEIFERNLLNKSSSTNYVVDNLNLILDVI